VLGHPKTFSIIIAKHLGKEKPILLAGFWWKDFFQVVELD
jgi:hypothetical protein